MRTTPRVPPRRAVRASRLVEVPSCWPHLRLFMKDSSRFRSLLTLSTRCTSRSSRKTRKRSENRELSSTLMTNPSNRLRSFVPSPRRSPSNGEQATADISAQGHDRTDSCQDCLATATLHSEPEQLKKFVAEEKGVGAAANAVSRWKTPQQQFSRQPQTAARSRQSARLARQQCRGISVAPWSAKQKPVFDFTSLKQE